MEPTNQGEVPKLSQVIQIDERKIQEHLGEVVRSTVEETLNALLDAEADRLCRAERYERTEARKDTQAGSYQRHLQTKAGEVTLKVPKLRTLPFALHRSVVASDSMELEHTDSLRNLSTSCPSAPFP
jgi:transposase-like protein